jgi:putative FmdB family regulatory protein
VPIYEYHCRACGAEFETLVSGPARAVACPRCRGSEVARLLSAFGLKTGGTLARSGGGCGCAGGGGCGCR